MTLKAPSPTRRLAPSPPVLALLFSAAMLAGAYAFQYLGGMQPCQMCLWQRWVHWGVMGAAVVALGIRTPALRPLLLTLVASALLASVITAGFHAGVEYGWWEGPQTCLGGLIDAEDLANAPTIFDDLSDLETPVDCSKPAWVMAGVSMAGWNALASLGALLAFVALWRKAK